MMFSDFYHKLIDKRPNWTHAVVIIKEGLIMSANTMDQDTSVLVLTGVFSIIFGVAAVFWPHLTLLTLLYLFSAYVLVSGIVRIITAFSGIGKANWWFLRLLVGFFELGVGVYLLRHVGVTFTTFILLIGFTLIARGVVALIEAFFESGVNATSRILSFIVGAAALLAGIVMLFQPVASGIAFVWILGLYALVAGTLEIVIASEANKAAKG